MCIKISKMGELIAVNTKNNSIYLYENEKEQLERLTFSKNEIPTCLSISEDLKYVVCGTRESTLLIYNLTEK